MRVAVIGAGIVGITTAHALSQSGHEVTVFERAAAAAEGSSFANSGILSEGLGHLLANPQWPANRWTDRFGAPDHMEASFAARLKNWRWQSHWKHPRDTELFLRNARAARELLSLSRERLLDFQSDISLEHEYSGGTLVLVGNKKSLAALQPKIEFLKEQQVKLQILTPQEVRTVEPSLNAEISLEAGLRFPDDSTHNCRQFALQLRSQAVRDGVQFHFNQEVTALTGGKLPSLTVEGQDRMTFDHIVVCTGTIPEAIANAVKKAVPLAVITGSSLSAPVREPTFAPHATVIDLSSSLTVGPMGNRVRVSGFYKLGNANNKSHPKTVRHLYDALQHYFPGAAQSQAGTQLWSSAFGSLPDGLPAIGPSSLAGVWLNIAHGTNGWGMACGSAELINALISGQPTPIDPTPFNPDRF